MHYLTLHTFLAWVSGDPKRMGAAFVVVSAGPLIRMNTVPDVRVLRVPQEHETKYVALKVRARAVPPATCRSVSGAARDRSGAKEATSASVLRATWTWRLCDRIVACWLEEPT